LLGFLAWLLGGLAAFVGWIEWPVAIIVAFIFSTPSIIYEALFQDED
jgi:hypothetical protein